jgi:hypothetical protein
MGPRGHPAMARPGAIGDVGFDRPRGARCPIYQNRQALRKVGEIPQIRRVHVVRLCGTK